MSTQNKAAFIIPVFNNYHFTEQCLRNLKPFSAKFNIIVVDDGSTDQTKDQLPQDFPWVHLLHGNGSLWWSGSINKGMEYAFNRLFSTYVIWWNNDIICAADYIDNVELLTQKYGPQTVIGSKIYYSGSENIIWSMGGYFNRKNGEKNLIGMLEPDGEKFMKPQAAEWLPGMGTIISKEVYSKTGPLNDKDFPQYHGDSDFTIRASNAGFRIITDPGLRIWNDKTNSGLMHEGKLGNLIKSLTDTRSNYNVKKDLRFYQLHSGSLLAYRALLKKYFRYTGGFLKWEILGLLKIRKKNSEK